MTDRSSQIDIFSECEKLRIENARLIALLEKHSIDYKLSAFNDEKNIIKIPIKQSKLFSTDEKIAIFRRLFRGRTDAYPIRWENKTGRSGYAPACANEWRVGVCEKPRIKCSDCDHRLLIPLTDQIIYDHLSGRKTLGVYPLLTDDTCYFLAVDFDEADWKADAIAFVQSCKELHIPVSLEISRSGKGAHAWVFFESAIPARDARRLGSAIISHTCSRTHQLLLTSYDRLFPNQDRMPKGGFGNLIALPLQKIPRDNGYSVFVDDSFTPYLDQWEYLSCVTTLSQDSIDTIIFEAVGSSHPLDVSFITEEDQQEPWKPRTLFPKKLLIDKPERVTVTFANQLFFPKNQLTQPLVNRLIRLAAFQNPEFYKAQAMRFPVWNVPRIIGCAENFPNHIALPRGCLDAVQDMFRENKILFDIQDERFEGESINTSFIGTLRPDQEMAVNAMLRYDTGVLSAPTAFGKTVTAAAVIAHRKVNTLILVHRTELLKQWQERLTMFLDIEKASIGKIGGGKPKLTGKIDIAVMQSLFRQGETNNIIENYGQIIIDECHHLSAKSFEAILKSARAKYVLGLTATPERRDGQHPIIFMQCGSIRHLATKPQGAPQIMGVIPRFLEIPLELPPNAAIQDIFRQLSVSIKRAVLIASDIIQAYQEGRKVLVLTERTEHIEVLITALNGAIDRLFILHGRLSRKQRTSNIQELESLAGEAPRVILATGRLVGEGFDHPPLDTLILAMPVSWKGTLQQYAGRLHREHASKTNVKIYDYIDILQPELMRMWDKRQRGYKAMGYTLQEQ